VITVQGFESPTPIGSGGYSTVFRALQPQFNRWVALKVLSDTAADDNQRKTFERECKAMGLVSTHPHIINILSAAYTSEGQPVIVMQLFDGGTVWERVERSGPISAPDVLDMGIKVASALETAHRENLLHRDLKPQNIMYSEYGQPALGDFGISLLTSDQTNPTPGGLTLHYAPPERLEGGAATPESDIYSLAATMYTALAGRRPFQIEGVSQTSSELSALIVGAALPPIDHVPVPQPLFDALAKAMAKNPLERPSSAADFARSLQTVQKRLNLRITPLVLGESELDNDVRSIAASRDETTSFGDVAPTTTRKVLAAVLAAVTIAAVSAFVLTRPSSPPPTEEVSVAGGTTLGLDNPETDAPILLRSYRVDDQTIRAQWVHDAASTETYHVVPLIPKRQFKTATPSSGRLHSLDFAAEEFGSSVCISFEVVAFPPSGRSVTSIQSDCDSIVAAPPTLNVADQCQTPCEVDLVVGGFPPGAEVDIRLESLAVPGSRSLATPTVNNEGRSVVMLDLTQLTAGDYLIWATSGASQLETPTKVIRISEG